MSDFWTWALGEGLQYAIAGAAGAIVRCKALGEDMRGCTTSCTIGPLAAVYLGPLALQLLEPVIGKLVVEGFLRVNLSGFIVGIGGIAVVGFVIDLWQARAKMMKKDAP